MEISVIVNSFNNEKTIGRCLHSVVAQTFSDFECIVIDDCSLDHTYAVCESFVKNDNRIVLVRNENNIGCSLTRKRGFEHSQGKHVVFIDGDDWLESDFLERLVGLANAENADLVYCDYFEEDGLITKTMQQNVDSKTKTQIIAAMASYDPMLVSSLWNKLIKRELVNKAEFPDVKYGEDMYISLQLAYYSKKSVYVPLPLYHYWVNNIESMCNNKEKESERRLAMYDVCEKILSFLSTHYLSNNLFEPMLSIRMNKTSLRIFEDKDLRSKRDAFSLYPPAIKHLFRKEVQFDLSKKLVFLFANIVYRISHQKNRSKGRLASSFCELD